LQLHEANKTIRPVFDRQIGKKKPNARIRLLQAKRKRKNALWTEAQGCGGNRDTPGSRPRSPGLGRGLGSEDRTLLINQAGGLLFAGMRRYAFQKKSRISFPRRLSQEGERVIRCYLLM
jgi:hypothetical protein